jgi:hypothetical protein
MLAAFMLPVGSAQARATLFDFYDTHTNSFSYQLPWCIPGNPTVNATVTETVSGQVVDTGRVVIVRGLLEVDDYLVLPDGKYIESGINRVHFEIVFNGPLTVHHDASQDFRTIYAADGTPVGKLMILETIHVTIRDVNGDGIPDPGEISVGFDHFRFRCL